MAILALSGATHPGAVRVALAATFALAALSVARGEDLFVSKRLTQPKLFTTHIEGPAVNADRDLFIGREPCLQPGVPDCGSSP
jgi:hypothetical protein